MAELRSVFSHIDFSGRNRIVVAVSGGGDSLALLFLLKQFLDDRGGLPRPTAVTVDHGLRPEAAAEAQAVAGLCRRLGVLHRTMRWQGTKPSTGLAAAAREARQALLAEAASDLGTDIVLTGHTADDQAETLAMRLARGGGLGEAGIAPATLRENVTWFVRPLLRVRRQVLRDFLRGLGVSWFDDPSNVDPLSERVRVRQSLADLEIIRLTEKASAAAREREMLGERAARLMSEHGRLPAPGLIEIDAQALHAADADVAGYTLRILLAVAGGTAHLPPADRTASLLASLREEGTRSSLSRAVAARVGGSLYFHRERRGLPNLALGSPDRPASQCRLWDGRYRICWREPVEGLCIGPDGGAGPGLGAEEARRAPRWLALAARAAQPAVWRGDRYLGPAGEWGIELEPVAGPWAHLVPCFDLAPARAVLHLLEGANIPCPPWAGHKAA
ncbi:tRNA(Ile)-lysidine synthase [Nitratireductor thuwali]|uniref:tRNA(Ile)-lysidine synthase n=2 Tax=Nitratireductor thuwali TaxID=2267699 RepID=A0ABY5MN07_9HYPH|nr:tRNA(Ile)-lysidine synthase [Nitratireductor thuwali]